jgi:hypothetical protein
MPFWQFLIFEKKPRHAIVAAGVFRIPDCGNKNPENIIQDYN